MFIFIVLQKDHLEWKKEFRRKQLRGDHVWPSANEAGVRKQLADGDPVTRGAYS